jgi:hypothetical protein
LTTAAYGFGVGGGVLLIKRQQYLLKRIIKKRETIIIVTGMVTGTEFWQKQKKIIRTTKSDPIKHSDLTAVECYKRRKNN